MWTLSRHTQYKLYNAVATGLPRRSMGITTTNVRQSQFKPLSEADCIVQKHKRIQVFEKWIFGEIGTGNIGLLEEIRQLIALYHENNDETLKKIKFELKTYYVEENAAPTRIFAKYNEFFYEHFNINDIIARNDEKKILEACNFLNNTHTKLINVITPGTPRVAENDLTSQIKKMLKIATMRTKEIDHALSKLKVPEISEHANNLLLSNDNCITTSLKVSVDVEQEWANIKSAKTTVSSETP